ncbi:phenylalanine--tRNA ligase subunit beta [Proteinivorax hydrogeniformans]|uniref:Phenylalanine--tRNA ligase beta subunit n=1 Tax=Proteinivorax hydrogeniformans TaxID=1826727 RepID=A0AAU8HR89_9FIRM
MRISYNWLKEYVNIDDNHNQLAEKLTDAGVVVEHVYKPFDNLDGVIVAEIKKISPHPDADKLSITEVSDGKELYQVVCGAQNIKVGQKVPFATVGTILPGNFKIKKSKIRGVESYGMLCAGEELNLDVVFEDGILILPSDTSVGISIEEALDLDDYVFELDLTPNRGDCLNMVGVAKEIKAITGAEFVYPEQLEDENKAVDFEVDIETEGCKNYVAQVLQDVSVKPSPIWLQIRLLKANVRPINNVVDISNYVMLELGQPLHCFDKETILSNKVVVKEACDSMEFITLDDEKRKVSKESLLITDGNRPLALAGVIGGLDSEVKDTTTNIVLESAYFDPISVRTKAKEQGIKTDASTRFEKGVDPARVITAANRANRLLTDICDAKLNGRVLAGDFSFSAKPISIEAAEINSKLGLTLSNEEIIDIFKRLECEVEVKEKIEVIPPSYRVDLTQTVDLIEEVARMVGYNNIPTSLPDMETTVGEKSKNARVIDELKDTLTSLGFFETMSYPFISKEHYQKTNMELDSSIKLSNPLSENESLMRTSMLPSIMAAVSHNQKHNIQQVEIFEVGKVYIAKELPLIKHPIEENILAVAMTSETSGQHWQEGKSSANDFYTAKGTLENLFSMLNIDNWSLKRSKTESYHPNKSGDIIVNGEIVGVIGEIHPEISDNWDIKGDVIVIELNLSKLVSYWDAQITYRSIPKHPAVSRDLAVVVDEDVQTGDMIDEIKKSNIKYINDSDVFDVYQGENIEAGKKSVALSIIIQAEKTLKEKEINKSMKQVMQLLEKKFQALLR